MNAPNELISNKNDTTNTYIIISEYGVSLSPRTFSGRFSFFKIAFI